MKAEEKRLLEFNDIRLLYERFQPTPSIDLNRSRMQIPALKVQEYDYFWSRALRLAVEGREDAISKIRAEIALSNLSCVSQKWWDFVLSFSQGAPPEELEQYEEEDKNPLIKVDPGCICAAIGRMAVPAAAWERKRRRMEIKELEKLQDQAGERHQEKEFA